MTESTAKPLTEARVARPVTARAPGDLPTWLAIIIVMLCLVGGGALVWWYFKSPPASVTITMQTPRAGDRNRAQPGQRPVVVDWSNDVRPAGNGRFQVRAGDARLRVTTAENGQWTVEPDYRVALLPADQLNFLRIRFFVRRDEHIQRLKLTPQQVESLRKLRINSSMVVSPEERKSLSDAWAAYDKATAAEKDAAKAKLIALLGELGKKNLEPTKAAILANIATIKEILTDEQEKLVVQN
jgi:hypothetical protein